MNEGSGGSGGKVAYLAYPIDQASRESDGHDYLLQIVDWFAKHNWTSYDPGAAWNVAGPVDRRVMTVNNMALGRSDAVVAFLPPGIPSIGVPIEIERAVTNGIPTLVIGGQESWALARYQNYPWFRIGREFESVEGLLGWLIAVQVGQRKHGAEQLPFSQLRNGEPEVFYTKTPRRTYDGDAGFDLVVSQRTEIPPGQMVDVPCNLAVELPDWAWGLIVGRSSTLRTKRLQVHPGVIDSGYRGELFAAVSQLTAVSEGGSLLVKPEPVAVEAGERLAQLIVMSNQSRGLAPAMVDQLNPSDRGSRGFGSSGR